MRTNSVEFHPSMPCESERPGPTTSTHLLSAGRYKDHARRAADSRAARRRSASSPRITSPPCASFGAHRPPAEYTRSFERRAPASARPGDTIRGQRHVATSWMPRCARRPCRKDRHRARRALAKRYAIGSTCGRCGSLGNAGTGRVRVAVDDKRSRSRDVPQSPRTKACDWRAALKAQGP